MEDEHKVWSILNPWMQWMLRSVGFSSLEMCVKTGLGTAEYKFDELVADVNDLEEKPWEGPTEEWAAWSGPVFRAGRPFKLYQAHRAQIHSFGEAARALMAQRSENPPMPGGSAATPPGKLVDSIGLPPVGADPSVTTPAKPGPGRPGKASLEPTIKKPAKAANPVHIPCEATFKRDTERLLAKRVNMTIAARESDVQVKLGSEYWLEWEGDNEPRRLIFCCKCGKRLKVWATINGFGAHPNCQSIYRHLEKCPDIWGPGVAELTPMPPNLHVAMEFQSFPDTSVPPLVEPPPKKSRKQDNPGDLDVDKGDIEAPMLDEIPGDSNASNVAKAVAAAAAAAKETLRPDPIPNAAPITTSLGAPPPLPSVVPALPDSETHQGVNLSH